MQTQRTNPGDITINSAILLNKDGRGINIKDLISSIVVYENIMTPFLTAEVTITDSINLAEQMPLIGEEQLFLDLENPFVSKQSVLRKELLFMVYKLGAQENVKLKSRSYTLFLISIEGFTDLNTRISKTYKGKVSDIAKSIIENRPGLGTKKSYVAEETSNSITYTSNFWSPSQNLYYLTSAATNKRNNPSYLFFECTEGFIFSSLDALYQQEEYMTFIRNSKTQGPGELQSLDEEYQKILDMSTPVHYDYIERLRSGFYGATIYNYDFITKRLNVSNRTENGNWAGTHATLNKHPALSDNLQFLPEAAIEFNYMHRELYNGDNLPMVEQLIKRKALLAQISATRTNIEVFGRLDYSIGKKIKLIIYKDSPIYGETPVDKIIDEELSGFYLITALSHSISDKRHTTNMELCKDSYIKNINETS